MKQNYSKHIVGVAIAAWLVGMGAASGQRLRPVTSAVPFLNITPDARAAGMGDVGVATSADANATFWNPAKLVFAEKKFGASLSYTPWFKALNINDMWFGYLSGYYQINKNQAIGMGLQYSNLGDINFTDESGNDIRDFRPREFALAPSFAQKFSDHLSGSVTLRLIYSNLSGNIDLAGGSGGQSRPGVTVAGDVALYYKTDLNLGGRDFNWALGANISNLGPKISYSTNSQREFIASNLRLGSALTYNIDPYNKVTFAADVNKLMVPTPRANNLPPPNKPLISGIFGSFADAPDGFSEEMKEFVWSAGLEYWYNNVFAMRGGYFRESREKGFRQYFTVGAGFRFSSLGLDAAYMIPTQTQSPLAETLRFTLHFDFGESDADDNDDRKKPARSPQ